MKTTPSELLASFNTRKATTKPKTNAYSQNGWQGCGYELGIDIKTIAATIRQAIKQKYPKVKVSVRISRYAGGQSLSVTLLSAPFNAIAQPDVEQITGQHARFGVQDALQRWQNALNNGHTSVNQYYINDSYYLTPEAKAFFTYVKNLCNYFNYDDSDAMTDYFNTNFYYDLAVGSYNKPFVKH